MNMLAQPTTGELLMAAILADPNDEAPRNAYADWLKENGDDERAWMVQKSPSLDWRRVKYGRWEWRVEKFYTNHQEAFWSSFGRATDRKAEYTRRYVENIFPQTWRRNLNRVIYRRGFVDELSVDRFHLSVLRLMETQPVRAVVTTSGALAEVINIDPFGKCKSLRKITLSNSPGYFNYVIKHYITPLGIKVEFPEQ